MIDRTTAGPGAAGLAGPAWNRVAFEAGRRLLVDWSETETVPRHVLELWADALATVAAEEELRTEAGKVHGWRLLATILPFGLGVRASVHAALERVFRWGARRVVRDRTVRDGLPDVLAAVVEARAELAAVRGGEAEAARLGERDAQDADVAAVLAAVR